MARGQRKGSRPVPKSVLEGKKSGKGSTRAKADALQHDEVDAFAEERERILLDDVERSRDAESSSSGDEGDDGAEHALTLGASASSSGSDSASGTDEDEDDSDDFEEVEEEDVAFDWGGKEVTVKRKRLVPKKDKASGSDSDSEDGGSDDGVAEDNAGLSWGASKSAYYDADHVEHEVESDEEGLREEEEEAKRLQRAQAAQLKDEDLALEGSSDSSAGGSDSDSDDDVENADSEDDDAGKRVERDVSGMTAKEKKRLLESDAPELLTLLKELEHGTDDLLSHIKPLLEKIEAGGSTNKGVSFLETKNQLLLHYLIDLVYYLLLRSEGASVKDHPVIEHLVETRTLLERLRPIDRRVKPQLERLLEMAETGKLAVDAASLRPRADAMAAGLEADEAEEDALENGDGVFQVRRSRAVAFEDEQRAEARRKKEDKRRLARSKKSAMLRDLRAELDEAPEEVREGQEDRGYGTDDEVEEKRRFEEEFMVRLPESKAERKKRKEKRAGFDASERAFGGLDDFGDIASLAGEGGVPGEAEERRREMQQFIENIDQRRRAKESRRDVGDADIPMRDTEKIRDALERGRQKKLAQEVAADEELRGEQDFDAMEDSFYKEVQQRQQRAKESKKRKHATSEFQYAPDTDVVDEGEKRRASKSMLENRGLRRYRKDGGSNPRQKYRKKATKATKDRQSMYRKADPSRSGVETTGIRRNLARSTKLS